MKVGSASQVWAEVGRSKRTVRPQKIAPRCPRQVGRSGVPDAIFFAARTRGGSVCLRGSGEGWASALELRRIHRSF